VARHEGPVVIFELTVGSAFVCHWGQAEFGKVSILCHWANDLAALRSAGEVHVT